MKTLVVHCHPNPDSFNHALYRTALEALEPRHPVKAIDLYAEGF
ncbi:NAD(P)H-dependent oxidoreductase, partial [Variovorax sp. RHLX14]